MLHIYPVIATFLHRFYSEFDKIEIGRNEILYFS